jgi:hypothetical protein
MVAAFFHETTQTGASFRLAFSQDFINTSDELVNARE